jgi:hypothetical protein
MQSGFYRNSDFGDVKTIKFSRMTAFLNPVAIVAGSSLKSSERFYTIIVL